MSKKTAFASKLAEKFMKESELGLYEEAECSMNESTELFCLTSITVC